MASNAKKELSQRAKLDAVAQAKERYVIAKSKLEYHLREQLKQELNNLQTQIDISVRYAVDDGCSKASVLRALGTKDYRTLYDSLDRTESIDEPKSDTFDKIYQFDPTTGVLVATYDSHGPDGISGTARFQVKRMEDQTIWLLALDPLWNEDYTISNRVVQALDQKQDGFYYEEAVAWLEQEF
jgi:hypothetical protein